MIMSLVALKKDVHEKMNNLRRIDSILESETFLSTWNKATEDQKLQLQSLVCWINKQGLIKYLKSLHVDELGSLNVRELRLLAKRRGLLNYMQMSKAILLSELTRLKGLYED